MPKTRFFPHVACIICLLMSQICDARGSNPPESVSTTGAETISATDGSAEKLAPEETKRKLIKGGEKHFYTVNADSNGCLRFVVEQNGVDVTIEITDAAHKVLKKIDRPSGGIGRETVTFLPPGSGVFQVEINSWLSYAPVGEYKISYTADTLVTAQDEKRSLAEDLTSLGERLRGSRDRESKSKALQSYFDALRIWNELGDRYEQAVICYGLGWTYHDSSRFTEAAVWFARGQKAMRLNGDQYGEMLNLAGLGWTLIPLGEHELVAHNFRQSLAFFRRINQETSVSQAAFGLGVVEYLMGDYETAGISLRESLFLREKLGDKRGQALVLISLANVQLQQNQPASALELLDRALKLDGAAKNKVVLSEALYTIGSANNMLGRYETALENFRQSLFINRELENILGEAKILNGFCVAYTALGQYSSAKENIEKALNLIETIRDETQGFRLRRSFNSTVQDFYENYLRLLMLMDEREPGKGYDREALHVSELSRSRSLLDLLQRRSILRENRISPGLIEQTVSYQAQVTSALLQYRQARSESERSRLALKIQDISSLLWEVESEINRPGQAAKPPRTKSVLPVSDIQNILDDNVLLLEYALTDEDAYLWAVSKKDIKSFRLAPSRDVREKARSLYECLSSAASRGKPSADDCREQIEKLSLILIAPISGKLGSQQLIIVAQEELQTVPFAALRNLSKGSFLIESHEIVNLPSASLLNFILNQKMGAANDKIALFADPVYEASDLRFPEPRPKNRLNAPETQSPSFSSDTSRSIDFFPALTQPRLPRLFASRFEVDGIENSVRPLKVVRKTDFAATRESVLQNDLSSFNVLHFATHTLLDEQHPELSAIALSMFDAAKSPINGWLRSSDILNLNLTANLVILSSCRSGVGKRVRGEGLMSLAQSFFAAGARRLIASQWKVEDKASAELMIRFYKHYYQSKNQNVIAALRSAQIEMMKDSRWHSPFYWASFSLWGDK
ncbi:MAG: CHAT domain-containing protein [Acidobacteriota bacterium]|nr:CHAT domain-containing protein [Acidobacteriota bacterium]